MIIPTDFEYHNADNEVDIEQPIEKTIPLFPAKIADYPERPKVAAYAATDMNYKTHKQEV